MALRCFKCGAELEPHYKACPICGDPISDFVREHMSVPIDGKYEIVSRLGVGGMGEVYKVRHIHLNSLRVIKLMRANIMTTHGAQERFIREAQLATQIQHPNVAILHDFATLPDQTYYMVWEFIDGINLAQLIRQKGTLSPREAARISIDALLGLDAIHQAGVVHRDVSPENIMLSAGPGGQQRVKVIDLGIAKQWDATSGATETGMFVGKWKYCSPEHLGVLEEGEHIDGRADIYSFGIVLYEMLAGRPPFEAETPHQYVVLHSRSMPKPLATDSIGDPQIERIVFKALEKDRTRRFATAAEFAEELRAILATLPDQPLASTRESDAALSQTEQLTPQTGPTQFQSTGATASPAIMPRPAHPASPTVVVNAPTEIVTPAPVAMTQRTVSPPPRRVEVSPSPSAPAQREFKGVIQSKLRDFLQTPLGKLTAVVVFLGFVGLVLPSVTTIIRWLLMIGFFLLLLIGGWKVYSWYRKQGP